MDRISRRRFVAGLAAAPAAGLGGPWLQASTLHNRHYAKSDTQGSVRQESIATDYALSIGALPVNYTGRPANAVAVNGGVLLYAAQSPHYMR